MSSMIKAVREYMAICPLLSEIPLKDRHIDWTSDTADNYGIFVDSDIPIRKFISGGGKYEYNFVLQFRLTTNDFVNLENAEFIERLQGWCDSQTIAKKFPVLPHGCTPTKISASNGMLFERDKNGKTGLYQIQIKLNYIKSGGN